MNLVDLLEKLSASMNSPFSVHWTKYSARCLLFFTLGYAVVALAATANRKHYRRGSEHGSARWGNVCRIAKRYRDKKNPKQNLAADRSCGGIDRLLMKLIRAKYRRVPERYKV